MSTYLINKNKRKKEILDMEDLEGYDFKPKSDFESPIKVKSIKIVDKNMIDKILSIKFERYFRRLAALALKVLEDDDSSDDEADIVLDEAQLVKEILENRYKKFLKYEKEQLFLKKIKIIEKQMEMKKIEIKRKAIFLEMQESMNRTRGM